VAHLQDISQTHAEFVTAATASALVSNDGLGSTAIKGNGTLDAFEQIFAVLGTVARADPATFFSTEEGVNARDSILNHVEHEPVAGSIVSAKWLVIFLAIEVAVEYDVLKDVSHIHVHCIDMTGEHDVALAYVDKERHHFVGVGGNQSWLKGLYVFLYVLFFARGVVSSTVREQLV
jgi:hypothetical protein